MIPTHTITTVVMRVTTTRPTKMMSTVSLSADRSMKAAITITPLWHLLRLRRQNKR